MNNEIEAQFLDIDKEEIRRKLKEIGAKFIKPEVLMKRVVFDTGPHSFARVRDEGAGKIVMTYKIVADDYSILGTKEVNVTIDSFENGVLFMKGCGLKPKAEQESYRETWEYGKVEICIDTWPWIPTFIEIEGPSEKSVWDTAKKLGLSKDQAKFGSVDTTYQHYYGVDTDIVNAHTPKILFEMEPPEWTRKKQFRNDGSQKIALRKPTLKDAKLEWELVRDIPEDENGFVNEWYGVSFEDFKKIVVPGWRDHEKGLNMKPGYVPDTHYFLWVDERPVGLFSLRHCLNDFLRSGPGHIGYGVSKEYRGRGYGTEGLRLLIEEARKLPIDTDEIYLGVLKTNPASRRVMEKNGAYLVGEDEKNYYLRIKL